jgi:predicted nucleic-acid-binding protein
MRALDTNVIVRLVARDDPDSEGVARGLLNDRFMLLPTVLLETEWVLRSIYKLPRQVISAGLRTLLGHEMAEVVEAPALWNALLAYDDGSDFADALHAELAATGGATSFATFDKSVSSRSIRVERVATGSGREATT